MLSYQSEPSDLCIPANLDGHLVQQSIFTAQLDDHTVEGVKYHNRFNSYRRYFWSKCTFTTFSSGANRQLGLARRRV